MIKSWKLPMKKISYHQNVPAHSWLNLVGIKCLSGNLWRRVTIWTSAVTSTSPSDLICRQPIIIWSRLRSTCYDKCYVNMAAIPVSQGWYSVLDARGQILGGVMGGRMAATHCGSASMLTGCTNYAVYGCCRLQLHCVRLDAASVLNFTSFLDEMSLFVNILQCFIKNGNASVAEQYFVSVHICDCQIPAHQLFCCLCTVSPGFLLILFIKVCSVPLRLSTFIGPADGFK